MEASFDCQLYDESYVSNTRVCRIYCQPPAKFCRQNKTIVLQDDELYVKSLQQVTLIKFLPRLVIFLPVVVRAINIMS